ncbi:Crp/Fnr family transcriptional regulator [Limosilactobacillus reuteri]|uniref:Crp/Fnr family transcriptional regulator n=3 Tax=Limosilactobacillus reuteri TaxID=1598 RepID=UPI001E462B54|nr:Crp/Fnr family transcriptional regulator [Limosilactobacillus reuteri]MCC4468290.1 Crp/Fnr family transcriptional regulator [Limosilactobacillus reuteri]MCC4472441.1 Crp/Fnr family transcriptional regulator [Limosilactobacillus reuteri]MCT3188297.1 Crp/Fnr family transcriptional regulator [Limosilactobacillus reuteri]MCT3197188.1 Crp/Fnr family transcriptional regulator [Limosilactobacillus reuteri]MDC6078170.1 Crp/Fnr family transcriptional regulator [Limosilactobacillus reuteri]
MKNKDYIHRVPLFTDLSNEGKKYLESLLHYKTFDKGDLIFSPDSQDELIIVVLGQMKVYKLNKDGKEHIIRIIGAGDYGGENYLFDLQNTTVYGIALTKTEVCVLYKADFHKLLKIDHQVGQNLLKLNAKKSVELERQAQLLSFYRVDVRLVAYLEDLYNINEEENSITLPMSLKDLASYLGTSAESLSHYFKEFETKGWIERHYRKILIKPAFWEEFK